ncbi:MinD/ParA family protein [Actinocorallia sp. B10E7]|uniref:MinD/ParA family protein n=1 Tax=Actinocorallia sp. B10E7 TaxID=3153558 RepID=UPI00325E105D
MPDWQLSTLRSLGLPSRGLAGGSPPAPAPAPADPLTSPVAPVPFTTRRDRPSSVVTAAARPQPGPESPAAQSVPVPPSPLDPLPLQEPGTGPAYGSVPAPTAPPSPSTPDAYLGQSGLAAPVYGDAPVPGTPHAPAAAVSPAEVVFSAGIHPEQGGAAAAVYGDAPVSDTPHVPEEAYGAHAGAGQQGGVPTEGVAWAQGADSSVDPVAGELVRRMRHGDPLARRVGRGMRRAVGARAAQVVREQEAAAGILGQVVSSCRRIAVTSLRGGAGKTTVTALVARTIAAHRGDRTLVLDADPSLGSLPLRLGVNAERTYRGLTTLPNWEAAQSYLTQAGERLWVASASSSRALTTELSLAEFQTAQGEFSRYFGISLVDCGPGLTSDLHQGILASSHAQILVAPATVDGALSTRSALDWFLRGTHAHLLQRTLVVMVTHTPHVDGDLNRSRALLAAEGVPVIHLPYDRHLAAGTAVDPSLLAEASQATAVHLATAAFTRATV